MSNVVGSDYLIEITYLIATALFILSLKWLSSPTTARRGVFAGELGMLLAIAGTLLHHGIVEYKWIVIGLVLGTIIGVPLGEVAMTAVPCGATGALNQNDAPPAICPGVQMNCVVIMKVQVGSAAQARTPVRSAWTRKPVTSTQALWLKRITMVLPAA